MSKKTSKPAIPCLVLPGMFSTERQVLVSLPDGEVIDALVDRSNVRVQEEPQPGKPPVKGLVAVSLVNYDKKKNQVLVDLPEGSFMKGPRIRIPSKMVEA